MAVRSRGDAVMKPITGLINKKPVKKESSFDASVEFADDFTLHELKPCDIVMSPMLLARQQGEELRKRYKIKKRKTARIR